MRAWNNRLLSFLAPCARVGFRPCAAAECPLLGSSPAFFFEVRDWPEEAAEPRNDDIERGERDGREWRGGSGKEREQVRGTRQEASDRARGRRLLLLLAAAAAAQQACACLSHKKKTSTEGLEKRFVRITTDQVMIDIRTIVPTRYGLLTVLPSHARAVCLGPLDFVGHVGLCFACCLVSHTSTWLVPRPLSVAPRVSSRASRSPSVASPSGVTSVPRRCLSARRRLSAKSHARTSIPPTSFAATRTLTRHVCRRPQRTQPGLDGRREWQSVTRATAPSHCSHTEPFAREPLWNLRWPAAGVKRDVTTVSNA